MPVIAQNLPTQGEVGSRTTDFSKVNAPFVVGKDNNGRWFIVDVTSQTRYALAGDRKSGSLHAALQLFPEVRGDIFLSGFTERSAIEAFGGPNVMERVIAGLLPVPEQFREGVDTSDTGFIANPQAITTGSGQTFTPSADDVDDFRPPTTPDAPNVPDPVEPEPRNFGQEAAALFPWLPRALRDIFVDEWSQSGNTQLAWAEVRASDVYEQYFPGNKRDDGSLVYDEQTYLSVIDSYEDALLEHGVNPSPFRDKFAAMIGDKSPQEFRSQVQALNERIVNQPEEIREAFAVEFGIDPERATRSAILGTVLDPEVGDAVRERRVSIAEVTGQAARFGFERQRRRVERLLNAGLDAGQAAQFFGQAASAVPRLGAQASRFSEGQFDVGALEDAVVFGSVDRQRQMRRLGSREASLFSRQGQVESDQTGALLGLTER